MDKRAARAIGMVVGAFVVAGLVARYILHDEPQSTPSAAPQKYAASAGTHGIRALSSGADFAFAVGDDGTILRHAARGGWSADASPTRATLRGVAQRLDEAVAVGDDGTIVELDGGVWKLVPSPTKRALRAIVDSSYGALAVGDAGTILRRAAPHDPWLVETSGTDHDFRGACAGLSDAWVVGADVILGRTLQRTWVEFTPAPHATLNAVDCDDHAGIAVGEKGLVLERLDDVPWHLTPCPTTQDLFAVSASFGTRSWLIVGAHGVTMRAGASLAVEPSGVDDDLRAVTEGALGTFLGSERGVLVRRGANE